MPFYSKPGPKEEITPEQLFKGTTCGPQDLQGSS